MLVEAVAAALICLDPGHGTPTGVGRQREPIGPGSRVYKEKDGGGAAGEAEVVLQIAQRTRTLLVQRGYRVAMTRTGPTFRYGSGGNVARAEYCNRQDADLMLRCFPRVEMAVFGLAGISPSPVVAVGVTGASIVLSAPDHETVSELVRSSLPHLGLVALISTYRVTAGQCALLAPSGGLTRCIRIGRALRHAGDRGDLAAAHVAAMEGVPLFSGIVAELVQHGLLRARS